MNNVDIKVAGDKIVICEDGAKRRVVPKSFMGWQALWSMWENHKWACHAAADRVLAKSDPKKAEAGELGQHWAEPVLVQRGGFAVLHVRIGGHACKV